MPHFKDAQNKLYFLDAADAEAQYQSHLETGTDGEGNPVETPVYISGVARWLPADCVPITDEEAEAIRNPPLTQAQTIARYEVALDAHLDAVAQAHRYRDRVTFALRSGYPGPYQAEGIAFGAWMDTCNEQAYALLAEVLAGNAPLPTIEGFIAGLPEFVAP